MEKSSFRDILLSHLRDEATSQDRFEPAQGSVDPEWSFTWSPANPHRVARPSAYPRPTPVIAIARKAKAVPSRPQSPKIPVARLSETERRAVETLVRLGAIELNGGLNLEMLKKAHRRLAKRLHPDAGAHAPAGAFLELQRAYETLRRALPKYMTSETACDSESASARASQRPAAA